MFHNQEFILRSPEKAGCPDHGVAGQLVLHLPGGPVSPTLHEPQGQSLTHNIHPTPITFPGT